MKPFKILELDSTASPDEVKQKYKQLLKVYHPDHGGTVDKFMELQAAYKKAVQISQDAKCPDCFDGKDLIVSGFRTIQVRCQACGGTGKKYK